MTSPSRPVPRRGRSDSGPPIRRAASRELSPHKSETPGRSLVSPAGRPSPAGPAPESPLPPAPKATKNCLFLGHLQPMRMRRYNLLYIKQLELKKHPKGREGTWRNPHLWVDSPGEWVRLLRGDAEDVEEILVARVGGELLAGRLDVFLPHRERAPAVDGHALSQVLHRVLPASADGGQSREVEEAREVLRIDFHGALPRVLGAVVVALADGVRK